MESLQISYSSLREVEFTEPEMRVLAAIREGCSSHKEIAARCKIAPITAQLHTGTIRKKLGLKKFIHLVLWVAVQEASE